MNLNPSYSELRLLEGLLILYIAVHLQWYWGEAMAINKTATLTFRINPELKEALRCAAEQEHRSIANMIEVLIRDYCEHRGISIPQGDDNREIHGARS